MCAAIPWLYIPGLNIRWCGTLDDAKLELLVSRRISFEGAWHRQGTLPRRAEAVVVDLFGRYG